MALVFILLLCVTGITTQPCKFHNLDLLCDYENFTKPIYEEQILNLLDLPKIDNLYIRHAKNLWLRGSSCTNLNIYNSNITFFDPYTNGKINKPSCNTRIVHLQNSLTKNEIPGKITELDLYRTTLKRLGTINGLNFAFIMNSTLYDVKIKNLMEANVKIISSNIENMHGFEIGHTSSVKFVESNITMLKDNTIVVLNESLLTLESTNLISPNNKQPVLVKEGGSLNIFSSTKLLKFFKPNNDITTTTTKLPDKVTTTTNEDLIIIEQLFQSNSNSISSSILLIIICLNFNF